MLNLKSVAAIIEIRNWRFNIYAYKGLTLKSLTLNFAHFRDIKNKHKNDEQINMKFDK